METECDKQLRPYSNILHACDGELQASRCSGPAWHDWIDDKDREMHAAYRLDLSGVCYTNAIMCGDNGDGTQQSSCMTAVVSCQTLKGEGTKVTDNCMGSPSL